MDNFNKDRVEGTADKLKGNVKEATGKVTDDQQLQDEGKADQASGELQDAFGKAKDKASDFLDKLKK